MKSFFKENMTFHEAIQVLIEGKRIRRKSERKGCVKIVTIIARTWKEKFGSYWLSNANEVSDYCSFSIEDVLATDWVIDD